MGGSIVYDISIHAPLTGSDNLLSLSKLFPQLFQSTLPLRGATCCGQSSDRWINISIHAPLTGSDTKKPVLSGIRGISIHAPLTGSDNIPLKNTPGVCHFNPRSPYGERLPQGNQKFFPRISIHAPLTGSDKNGLSCAWIMRYFNPRSPYGERPPRKKNLLSRKPFQSTLPLRGATTVNKWVVEECEISIHAPLTGSDYYQSTNRWGRN